MLLPKSSVAAWTALSVPQATMSCCKTQSMERRKSWNAMRRTAGCTCPSSTAARPHVAKREASSPDGEGGRGAGERGQGRTLERC